LPQFGFPRRFAIGSISLVEGWSLIFPLRRSLGTTNDSEERQTLLFYAIFTEKSIGNYPVPGK
jgi:hypothetical protein